MAPRKPHPGPHPHPVARPLHDRVLLVRVEENEASVGGIIVPDTARQKPERARVVAVGAGRILPTGGRVPPSLRPGDLVLVSRWARTEITLDTTEYLILREDEILGILG